MQPQLSEYLDDLDLAVPSAELWLPSKIGSRVHWDRQLGEQEWLLRQAQARDALGTLRQNLQLRDFLINQKKKWSRGVRENTRSQTVIEQASKKISASKIKYSTARIALSCLAPFLNKDGSWSLEFRELQESDIQGLPADGLGEGQRSLSWIWTAPGVARDQSAQPQFNDGQGSLLCCIVVLLTIWGMF
jgi:hypothetical protein